MNSAPTATRLRAADTLLLGGGTPAFGGGPVPPLRLLDTRRRDGSDNVLVRYQVIGRDA